MPDEIFQKVNQINTTSMVNASNLHGTVTIQVPTVASDIFSLVDSKLPARTDQITYLYNKLCLLFYPEDLVIKINLDWQFSLCCLPSIQCRVDWGNCEFEVIVHELGI